MTEGQISTDLLAILDPTEQKRLQILCLLRQAEEMEKELREEGKGRSELEGRIDAAARTARSDLIDAHTVRLQALLTEQIGGELVEESTE